MVGACLLLSPLQPIINRKAWFTNRFDSVSNSVWYCCPVPMYQSVWAIMNKWFKKLFLFCFCYINLIPIFPFLYLSKCSLGMKMSLLIDSYRFHSLPSSFVVVVVVPFVCCRSFDRTSRTCRRRSMVDICQDN